MIVGILFMGLSVISAEPSIGLVGAYTSKAGSSYESAYLIVEQTNISYKNSNAMIGVSIYKSYDDMLAGKNVIGGSRFNVIIRNSAYGVYGAEETLLYTVPAFADVLGTAIIIDPAKNAVALLYDVILLMPEFSGWTNKLPE